jgi:hypothetical protein
MKARRQEIRNSPRGGKRGCLCKNNTYDSKCCTGELQNQGIGSDVTPPQPVPPAPNWNPLP